MRTKRFASLAAAIAVGGGTLLAASGADAMLSMNGIALMNGLALANGVQLANGISLLNGRTSNAAASQDFDFNSVSVLGVTLTQPWVCPPPVDRRTAVSC